MCSFDQCLTCGIRDFPPFLSAVHLPEFRCLQPTSKISWDCKKRITVLRSPLIFKVTRNIAVLEAVCFLSQNIVFSPFTLFTWLLLSFRQVLVILAFALCPVTLHSIVSVTYYLTPNLLLHLYPLSYWCFKCLSPVKLLPALSSHFPYHVPVALLQQCCWKQWCVGLCWNLNLLNK